MFWECDLPWCISWSSQLEDIPKKNVDIQIARTSKYTLKETVFYNGFTHYLSTSVHMFGHFLLVFGSGYLGTSRFFVCFVQANTAPHPPGAFRPSLRSEVAGALLILRSEEGEFAIAAREVLLECRSVFWQNTAPGARRKMMAMIPRGCWGTGLYSIINH